MAYDPENIFAKILRGEIPCTKLGENDHALAFADINPHAPYHALVIPKSAYVDFAEFAEKASADEMTALMGLAAEVAQAAGLAPSAGGSGFRVISNVGADAHQEVPHFHLHILGGHPLGPLLAR